MSGSETIDYYSQWHSHRGCWGKGGLELLHFYSRGLSIPLLELYFENCDLLYCELTSRLIQSALPNCYFQANTNISVPLSLSFCQAPTKWADQ